MLGWRWAADVASKSSLSSFYDHLAPSLLYWDMETRKVVHQEKQENIQQIFYYKNQSRCVVVSKKGSKGNESGFCVSRCVPEKTGIRFKTFVSRSVPEGTKQWEFEFPFVTFIKVTMLTPTD